MITRALIVAAAVLSFAVSASGDEVELELVTGEVLRGNRVAQGDQEVVLQHPVLGRLTVPRGSVAAVRATGDGASQPAVAPTGAPAAPAPPDPAAEAEPRKGRFHPWDAAVDLGFVVTDGNTETANVRAAVKALRETERARTRIDVSYYYGRSGGQTTEDELKLRGRHDWPRPARRWFPFAEAGYERDRFEAWDHRLDGFVGVGYEVYGRPDLKVRVRTGPGVAYEIFDDAADELQPEWLVGAEGAWNITESQSVAAAVALLADLDDVGESRLTGSAEWQLRLTRWDGVYLKFGVENAYESQTQGDAEHNDLKVYGAVSLDF